MNEGGGNGWFIEEDGGQFADQFLSLAVRLSELFLFLSLDLSISFCLITFFLTSEGYDKNNKTSKACMSEMVPLRLSLKLFYVKYK